MNDITVRHGDCVDVLATLDECSVDAVVTDPPYELNFMGQAWDRTGIAYQPATWRAVLRVLKPGGHLLAFGGTRTYHRMVCAVEDAGFEIRDTIAWMYGSGFPKSLDVGKAIDAHHGAQREVVAESEPVKRMIPGADQNRTGSWIKDNGREFVPTVTAPATPDAEQWDGWGTALKPAHEPIVVARKPLAGTVAANVVAHGTGALNIDAARISAQGRPLIVRHGTSRPTVGCRFLNGSRAKGTTDTGRWPANVVLDGHAADQLDQQTGELQSGYMRPTLTSGKRNVYQDAGEHTTMETYGDRGGASRFFYCAKASSADRGDGNTHPTVKPVELMRWLVRLVTPPGGLVVDPFAGSGTTGVAAAVESRRCLLIEREGEYVEIARRRLAEPIQPVLWGDA